MKAIIGEKAEMTQIFDESGNIIPTTIVKCRGTTVLGKRTMDSDGYNSLMLGYGTRNDPNRPLRGFFKKTGIRPTRVVREVRTADLDSMKIGDVIGVTQFEVGDRVRVRGISKGKGLQGPIKRWGFHRGPMTHGSKSHRVQGSIGSSASPSRVWKGKKMAGKMGARRTTVKNLSIVKIDEEQNLLYIKGALPGVRGGLLVIRA